ncbi:S1 family peptidase [Labedaea rhizosphaerae]|uniref:Trypsin n=1 Tax=Labedaea rhizosphaerae TaxID=598644 RepID=A0A4R6SFA4_LABRH|nr:S1 family peptidase [Labedaea rhizosphaerae]TDQ00244.1 trypsin [Labedaea rhizosphaerae]
MRRRTSLAVVALATATLMSLAFVPTVAAQASPGLLAAMQHDLGLTTEQASLRLAQEHQATDVLPAAQHAAGAAYGGAWFDPTRGKLVVGVTDPAVGAAVRNTGSDTVLVPVSAAELDGAKAALDRSTAPASVTSWRTDPKTGHLVVSINRSDAAALAFVKRAKASGIPVRVESAPRPVTASAGTVGGDPYYINGNVRCSIGFSVQGGFVSAGHCGSAGSTVTGWDGSAMGSFVDSSFPGNDYSYVSIGNGWWTTPVVLGWGTTSDQLVRGSNVAPPGTSICRSGSTTHWHCGVVEALNETVNYAQGSVYELTRTSVCAEPGDSGGSFISGDQAQGVTSGTNGNCTTGGQTWFQPVNEILQRYGLTLVTA